MKKPIEVGCLVMITRHGLPENVGKTGKVLEILPANGVFKIPSTGDHRFYLAQPHALLDTDYIPSNVRDEVHHIPYVNMSSLIRIDDFEEGKSAEVEEEKDLCLILE